MQRKIAVLFAMIVLGLVGVYSLVQRGPSTLMVENPIAMLKEDGSLDVIFTLNNTGGPDVLLQAGSNAAAQVDVFRPAPFDLTVIPAETAISFSKDGVYITLAELDKPAVEGALLPISLTFENAGKVTFNARVTTDANAGKTIEELAFAELCTAEESSISGNGGDVSLNLAELLDLGAPSIAMAAPIQTETGGWKLSVATQNFVFRTTEGIAPHIPGQGHGHIYLNGLKIGRIYSSDAMIGRLPAGTYVVSVGLNRNDHHPYVVNGQQIIAQVTLHVSG